MKKIQRQSQSGLQEKQQRVDAGTPQARAPDQNLQARWSARSRENGHEHDPEASHGADDHRQKQDHREADAEAKHEGHDGGAEPGRENEKKTEADRAAGQQKRA